MFMYSVNQKHKSRIRVQHTSYANGNKEYFSLQQWVELHKLEWLLSMIALVGVNKDIIRS